MRRHVPATPEVVHEAVSDLVRARSRVDRVSVVLPAGFHDEPLCAPPTGRVAAEAWAVRELPRLLLRAPRLLSAPRGAGAPVMVLPGHSSSDAWTSPLRAYLRWLGYDARGWGLGTNHGDVEALVPQVRSAVQAQSEAHGAPVHLVGWSLGGVLAREVARELAAATPSVVAQVITYGTPVVGGPAYTVARPAYDEAEVERIIALVAERNAASIGVPVTALFSRRDRVVAWRACIDTHAGRTEHVEVRSTHLGLGIDPDVWLEVARRLHRVAVGS